MPQPPNQVSPLLNNNKLSSFNKFQLREKLGIKQLIEESDIEDFKKDGFDLQNLQIKTTLTPKMIMHAN